MQTHTQEILLRVLGCMNTKMEALLYPAIAFLAAFCHYPALLGDFVFDDNEAILTNNDIDPNLSSWTDVFEHDFWGNPINSSTSHKSYRPLTMLSFRFDFLISGGKNPFVFHLVNLVLHSFVVILFVLVAQTLQKTFSVSNGYFFPLIAGALFATHPIHTESVAGIVGRAELWCATMYFIAFLVYHKISHLTEYSILATAISGITVIWLAGIGMLFKEQGITILGVCFLYELIKDHKRLISMNKVLVFRLMFISVGTAILLYLRLIIMNTEPPVFQRMDNPAVFENNTFTKIMSLSYIYSINFWLLFNPQWLCFDWSMGCIPLITSITDIRILVVIIFWSSLAIYVMFIVICLKGKARGFIMMCSVFFIIPFLPASNIFFKVGFVIAERVLYLPSAGYCMLIAYGLSKLYKINKKLTVPLTSIVVLVFAARSLDRSFDWMTEENLFTAGLAVCNKNAKVHYNVGKIRADKGFDVEAEDSYREAIRLYPEYDQALNNLGNLLRNTDRPLEAEIMFERALNASPKFATAWMNFGILQMSVGKYKNAEESYMNAIRYRKKYADAYYNIGLLYIMMQRYPVAVNSLKSAINYKPHHLEAWNNLGLLYQNLNQFDSAEAILRLAITRFPNLAQFYSSLGVVLGKQGNYEEGKKQLLTALEKDPNNAKYYGNLGVIFHLAKEYESAKHYYERALEINSSLPDTRQNLEKLKTKLNTIY